MLLDFKKIQGLLRAAPPDKDRVLAILEKAGNAKGLDLEEAAALLNSDDRALMEDV